jgi:hypothetical protein
MGISESDNKSRHQNRRGVERTRLIDRLPPGKATESLVRMVGARARQYSHVLP